MSVMRTMANKWSKLYKITPQFLSLRRSVGKRSKLCLLGCAFKAFWQVSAPVFVSTGKWGWAVFSTSQHHSPTILLTSALWELHGISFSCTQPWINSSRVCCWPPTSLKGLWLLFRGQRQQTSLFQSRAGSGTAHSDASILCYKPSAEVPREWTLWSQDYF